MVIKLWAKWSGSKWLPDTVKELVRKKSKGNETGNFDEWLNMAIKSFFKKLG